MLKKVLIFAANSAAILAMVLAAGCGSGTPAEGQRSPHNLFINGPNVPIQVTTIGILVDDHVVTSDQGVLRGKLPPARPVEVVTRGNPDLKRVAITIDDGWNADMRILSLLKSWKVRFTAFLIGDRGVADAHPEFVRAIQKAGGEVCNHTYTHYVMKGKDEATVMDNIWKGQDVITHVTHEIYPYIRFSGGDYDAASLNWAAREGFWLVNWTADSGDTRAGATVGTEVASIMNNVRPGAILLFHWGGHNTYEVLSRVIPEIQKQGYEVTNLSRVLQGTPFVLKKKG